MDFRELRLLIRRNAAVAGAVFMVFLLIGVVVSRRQPSYEAVATATLNAATVKDVVATAAQVNFAMPTLQQLATSQRLRADIAGDLPVELRGAPVTVTAEVEVSVLTLTVSAHEPETAQAWANAIIEALEGRSDPDVPIRVTALDRAAVPTSPASLPANLVVGAAVLLGAILALAAAIAAQRLRDSGDNASAVRELAGVPLLGEIPRSWGLRRVDTPLITMLGQGVARDLVASFETIRTNLIVQIEHVGATTVAVVSPRAGAGCTTVVAGVGFSMATVRSDVVLVEADLRAPNLPRLLGVSAGRGLGGMAVLGTDHPQTQSTAHPHLRLVAAGVPAGRPADVVTTTLPATVRALADPSRLVIIDTPPLASAPEAMLAAAVAHHVVVVVNARSSEFMHLPATIARLQDSGAVVIGVVVNRVSRLRWRGIAPSEPAARIVTDAEDVVDVDDHLPTGLVARPKPSFAEQSKR